MRMAAVASSSPMGFSKTCGSTSEFCGKSKPTVGFSKSEVFGGCVRVKSKKISGIGTFSGDHVVSNKVVSDTSSSLTCLDPDASSSVFEHHSWRWSRDSTSSSYKRRGKNLLSPWVQWPIDIPVIWVAIIMKGFIEVLAAQQSPENPNWFQVSK